MPPQPNESTGTWTQWAVLALVAVAAATASIAIALGMGLAVTTERMLSTIIVLSLVLAAFMAAFVLREKRIGDPNTFRVTVLLALIFIVPAVVLCGSLTESDIAPVWGLFGTIVGYVLRGFGSKEGEGKE